MTETSPEKEPKKSLSFKLKELDISPQTPWKDDVLERKRVANSLTNLILGETESLVIGLNGHWGTGKTFILKRWQKELEKKGYKSIYFNAWEDDFCHDPLVAIIGQLSDSLHEKKFENLAEGVKKSIGPLLIESGLGFLSKATGIPVSAELLKQLADQTLESYSDQRKGKDKLKKNLTKMSRAVKKQTGHQLVFIIDELDRCRPTFAIELLERVKHIFNIPNMVFVIGVNRNELCSAIESIYGDIDADIYLRRFFDMEFALPEANSEVFCQHLVDRYGLDKFFSAMGGYPAKEFNTFRDFFPLFCNYLDLSLRDINQCVRSIVFVAKHIKQQHFMLPHLLGILVILRLKNNKLYQRFVHGRCLSSEVMNYIDEEIASLNIDEMNYYLDSEMNRHLQMMEAHLYCVEKKAYPRLSSSALNQLKLQHEGEVLTHPDYLSDRTRQSDKERQAQLINFIDEIRRDIYDRVSSGTIRYLSGLIDLSEVATWRDKRR